METSGKHKFTSCERRTNRQEQETNETLKWKDHTIGRQVGLPKERPAERRCKTSWETSVEKRRQLDGDRCEMTSGIWKRLEEWKTNPKAGKQMENNRTQLGDEWEARFQGSQSHAGKWKQMGRDMKKIDANGRQLGDKGLQMAGKVHKNGKQMKKTETPNMGREIGKCKRPWRQMGFKTRRRKM